MADRKIGTTVGLNCGRGVKREREQSPEVKKEFGDTFSGESMNASSGDEGEQSPKQEGGTSNGNGTEVLRKPWGIAVNSRTEQIYIADRQYDVILVYGSDGQFDFQFGGPGEKMGRFFRPTALAYDSVGDRLFVADKDNNRIQVFDPTGRYLFEFGGRGTEPGCIEKPWGISVSRDGAQVVVADTGNHRIQLYRSDGTHLRHFTNYSESNKDTLYSPRGVVFDNSGKFVYITDFQRNRIFRLDLATAHFEIIIDRFNLLRPSGIDVDASGNLVVCETRKNAVKIFQPDGRLVTNYTSVGNKAFEGPMDVAVVPNRFMIVIDLNCVFRIIH